MKHQDSKHHRRLAIAPSSRGFGYAVMEGETNLVDWGVKTVRKGDKNAQSLKKIERLIVRYRPEVLVMQAMAAKGSRRSPRIQVLSRQIIALTTTRRLKVKLFSETQMKQVFLAEGRGTRHALAEAIAQKFPNELGFRLPPMRRTWASEDSRIDIFIAVALVLTPRM